MSERIDAFASYLRNEEMRAASTIERYRRVIENFEGFLTATANGHHLTFENAGRTDLSAFLCRDAATHEKPSKNVRNMRVSALRSFYRYLAEEAEAIALNPAERLKRIKVRPKERVPLSFDEYLTLVDAMDEAPEPFRRRNRAIVHVFFQSSLRVAEVSSLDISQVDFQNYKFLDVRLKGDKWVSPDFNDLVAEAIGRYLRVRDRLAASSAQPALFVSKRGTRLSVRSIQKLLSTYGKKAGISRPVTPHLLRHSCVTELSELGIEMVTIQGICGHESVTTTERYRHGRSSSRRRAVDALGVETLRRMKSRGRSQKDKDTADSA